jgi:hypothetical protein
MKKMISVLLAFILIACLSCDTTFAKGGSGHGGHGHSGSSKSISKARSSYEAISSSGKHKSFYNYSSPNFNSTVQRDSNGRIHRSESAKKEFLHEHGLTRIPPGYQIDHIIPLYAGGADVSSNMQLLSISAHEAKTKSDYQIYGK